MKGTHKHQPSSWHGKTTDRQLLVE